MKAKPITSVSGHISAGHSNGRWSGKFGKKPHQPFKENVVSKIEFTRSLKKQLIQNSRRKANFLSYCELREHYSFPFETVKWDMYLII